MNLITQWVDSLDTLDEVTEANFMVWVKHEGPKRAGHAVGSETTLLRLDSETDRTSEGV